MATDAKVADMIAGLTAEGEFYLRSARTSASEPRGHFFCGATSSFFAAPRARPPQLPRPLSPRLTST